MVLLYTGRLRDWIKRLRFVFLRLAYSYDLAILDIKMPDLNGFALYREIKRLDKKIKVCFLTAGEMYSGPYSDIFSSVSRNYFIRKPIENEELMKRINEIIHTTVS